MKITINGGKTFDLLEDGDFFATTAEFVVGGNSVSFLGFWYETGDPDDGEIPAILDIISKEDVTEENFLNLSWETWTVAGI